MQKVEERDVRSLVLPKNGSHKGQNGRLLIIGGSSLFHAASIWALEVASRIVDLVHYASVPENNELVKEIKKEFRDGIVIAREDIGDYIEEDDSILIGPGMMRDEETATLTHLLLTRYPQKRWIIDAGALQMLSLSDIPDTAILTPHHQEFAGLWEKMCKEHPEYSNAVTDEDKVKAFAKTYRCIVLLKGETDIVASGGTCDPSVCRPGDIYAVGGGNPGMTKGGTGDVLAGVIAAFSCTNDPLLSVLAGSFVNKKAGDDLYRRVGPFFNASDLTRQIPRTLKRVLIGK
jgi:hydroxyethylthiazole kinase-like uncharacterized protein yjeF